MSIDAFVKLNNEIIRSRSGLIYKNQERATWADRGTMPIIRETVAIQPSAPMADALIQQNGLLLQKIAMLEASNASLEELLARYHSPRVLIR